MSDDGVVKHRKVVSSGQLAILELLYKYRFGSIELLRISLGLHEGPGLYKKLKILVDGKYVGKRYESSYRIKGIPAAYHLLAKGFRELQKLPNYPSIDEKLIKYSYRDNTVKQPFIADNLCLYSTALELMRLYPELKLFTQRDLAHRPHFPKKLPDGFVSLKATAHDKPFRYFLDIIPDDTPRYIVDKKIVDYYEFFDEYDWEVKTKSKLPAMLLLTESGSYEKRLQRLVDKKQRALDSDDLEYFTSTLVALKNATSQEKDIWSNVEDPDELLDLVAIGINS
jgi:hypothetical protein